MTEKWVGSALRHLPCAQEGVWPYLGNHLLGTLDAALIDY